MGAKFLLLALAAGVVGFLYLPSEGPSEGPVEGPVQPLPAETGGVPVLAPSESPAVQAVAHSNAVLARTRFDYRDDHGPGRVVAEVQCRLERGADGAVRLHVVPSASGPLVDPIPGFRGVRGDNHRTALELERAAAAGTIELVTAGSRADAARGVPASRTVASETLVPRTGRLAERRRTAAGKIEHGVLGAPRTTALELATGALAPGDWESTVVVGGRPRLAIDFTFDGERGAILAVRNVAETKETQP